MPHNIDKNRAPDDCAERAGFIKLHAENMLDLLTRHRMRQDRRMNINKPTTRCAPKAIFDRLDPAHVTSAKGWRRVRLSKWSFALNSTPPPWLRSPQRSCRDSRAAPQAATSSASRAAIVAASAACWRAFARGRVVEVGAKARALALLRCSSAEFSFLHCGLIPPLLDGRCCTSFKRSWPIGLKRKAT
jgi:hypothetical protein